MVTRIRLSNQDGDPRFFLAEKKFSIKEVNCSDFKTEESKAEESYDIPSPKMSPRKSDESSSPLSANNKIQKDTQRSKSAVSQVSMSFASDKDLKSVRSS